MPPKNKRQALRQTTLFDRPSPSSPSKASRSPVRRRTAALLVQAQASKDDSEDGLAAIKLEPKKTVEQKKKRRKTGAIREKSARKRLHPTSTDEEQPVPRRRRLTKGKQRAVVETSSSSEDLAAEVEEDRIVKSRFRDRNKKTAFQKSLEKLKRRKQGKALESSASSEEDETESEAGSLLKGAKPTSDYDSLFDEDSDASNPSDFIVEDDGGSTAVLPMQFSMESHQDLDHQFKKVFQFFVHIAVRPAKERHDFMQQQMRKEEYFFVPLQVVRRKLSGLRDSLVASSTWRPEFKKPLETFPDFDLVSLDFAVPSCDACHLGGRMSTLIGRLSGLPYDKWGFEAIDDFLVSDSGSNSDSDSEKDAKDQLRGTKEFHLGRFCARRTRVYHEFTHWEFNLFKCIRDEVDELHASRQSGGFFRIAYAGGKKPPKDLDDADGICEWLDERKVIDTHWEKIKLMMESARHLELASKKNDDD